MVMRRMQKRMIKRGLELVGAIAVVYLMLELLESHTMEKTPDIQAVQINDLPRAEAKSDAGIPSAELKKLQDQLDQVQKEQAMQKVKEAQQPQVFNKPVQQAAVKIQPKVVAKPPAKQALAKPAAPKKPPAKPAAPKKPPVKPAAPKKLPVKPVAKQAPAAKEVAKSADAGNPQSLDLGVSTDFKAMNIPIPSLKSKGYVLPMLYFDMGPNNLFRLFRQGAVTAYEMGRSIVVPVFHRHPRMGDAAENPFELPIFDTNYTVDLVWPPSETIDAGLLGKAMNVVSMKDFQKKCGKKLDVQVVCGEVDAKRMDGIKHFQRAANMKIMKEITIKSYEELVPNDLSEGIIKANEYECLGVVYGKKCLPSQDRWLATFSRIAKNFWRPLNVRKFALDFLEQVMEKKPYMAVHWRYESDWLDMCKPSRPKGARERNKEICKITMGLSYDEDVRNSFIQSIKDKMADYNIQTIYLASPPNNIDLIRLMKESFPENFFYADDVLQFAEKTGKDALMANNYKASFIEQEICFRSTMYLGAPLSSWTQTILTDRLARNIKRHDSILKVVGKGKPGYPELIFQFPEGNFNFGGMIPGKKV